MLNIMLLMPDELAVSFKQCFEHLFQILNPIYTMHFNLWDLRISLLFHSQLMQAIWGLLFYGNILKHLLSPTMLSIRSLLPAMCKRLPTLIKYFCKYMVSYYLTMMQCIDQGFMVQVFWCCLHGRCWQQSPSSLHHGWSQLYPMESGSRYSNNLLWLYWCAQSHCFSSHTSRPIVLYW